MIKTKRLKNLKLLKQKKLNKLTIEINTLNSEIKKNRMRENCKSDDEKVRKQCHINAGISLRYAYTNCSRQFSGVDKKKCTGVIDNFWLDLGVPVHGNETVKRHEVIKNLNPALIQYISKIEDSTKFENNLSSLFHGILNQCKADYDTLNTPCMSKCHSYIDAYNQKVKSAITMNSKEEACLEEAKKRVDTLPKQIEEVLQEDGDFQKVIIRFLKAEPEKFENCLKR